MGFVGAARALRGDRNGQGGYSTGFIEIGFLDMVKERVDQKTYPNHIAALQRHLVLWKNLYYTNYFLNPTSFKNRAPIGRQ